MNFVDSLTMMGTGLFVTVVPPKMILKGIIGDEFKKRLKIIRICGVVMMISGAIMLIATLLENRN